MDLPNIDRRGFKAPLIWSQQFLTSQLLKNVPQSQYYEAKILQLPLYHVIR